MNAFIVNSFVYNNHGGNPAGVVIENDSFPPDQAMQSIASQLGLSETAFVVNGKGEFDYEFKFFTPTDEVPLCGHATLASVYMLYRLGHTLKNELLIATGAGPIHIKLLSDNIGISIYMKQPSPKSRPLPLDIQETVAGCFDVPVNMDQYPVEIWNTGLDDLIVGVDSSALLDTMKVDLNALKSLSETLNIVGAHVFALDDNQVFARNFAPLFGIDEESATGTSNGALIAYLHKHVFSHQERYEARVLQGVAMGKPSAIHASSEKTQTDHSVWVGGHCKWVETISI